MKRHTVFLLLLIVFAACDKTKTANPKLTSLTPADSVTGTYYGMGFLKTASGSVGQSNYSNDSFGAIVIVSKISPDTIEASFTKLSWSVFDDSATGPIYYINSGNTYSWNGLGTTERSIQFYPKQDSVHIEISDNGGGVVSSSWYYYDENYECKK